MLLPTYIWTIVKLVEGSVITEEDGARSNLRCFTLPSLEHHLAVLGLQDEYSGERPKAFVVLKKGVPGGSEVEKELIGYVKERKVRHKWITEVEFVEAISKSASGKILRVLRDQSRDW